MSRSAVVLVSVLAVFSQACREGAVVGAGREVGGPGRVSGAVTDPLKVKAVFFSPDGRVSGFQLEVADDPVSRAKGLMFRRSLPRGEGMLFVFPREEVQEFYMKNTYVPLDMIFVNADLVVVGVVEDARPLTLDTRSVGVPSMYVVEVNAFTARSKGITPGSRVEFEPTPRIPVR